MRLIRRRRRAAAAFSRGPRLTMSSAFHIQRSTSVLRGKIRVLVVDDSLVIRHLVKVALEESPEIEVRRGGQRHGGVGADSDPQARRDHARY